MNNSLPFKGAIKKHNRNNDRPSPKTITAATMNRQQQLTRAATRQMKQPDPSSVIIQKQPEYLVKEENMQDFTV